MNQINAASNEGGVKDGRQLEHISAPATWGRLFQTSAPLAGNGREGMPSQEVTGKLSCITIVELVSVPAFISPLEEGRSALFFAIFTPHNFP